MSLIPLRRAHALLAAALALYLCAGASAAAESPLVIAVARTPLSAPFYVAQAAGLFKTAGVEVRIDDAVGGHRAMEALLAGNAQLATSSDLVIMFNAFARDDFAVLATFASASADTKLVVRQGVKGASDLAGRRVGYTPRSSSHYYLDTFLTMQGIAPGTLSWVELGPDAMAIALRSGKVDAVSTWEPFASQALAEIGPAGTVLSSPGVYSLTFNLIARRDLLGPRNVQLQAVLRALDGAVALMRKDPGKTQQVIAGRLAVQPGALSALMQGYRYGVVLEQALLIALEQEARWAVRAGHKAPPMPDFLHFLHPSTLAAVRRSAVTLIH